jgi:hypothetical protein
MADDHRLRHAHQAVRFVAHLEAAEGKCLGPAGHDTQVRLSFHSDPSFDGSHACCPRLRSRCAQNPEGRGTAWHKLNRQQLLGIRSDKNRAVRMSEDIVHREWIVGKLTYQALGAHVIDELVMGLAHRLFRSARNHRVGHRRALNAGSTGENSRRDGQLVDEFRAGAVLQKEPKLVVFHPREPRCRLDSRTCRGAEGDHQVEIPGHWAAMP